MELWQESQALWHHICSSESPTAYLQPPQETHGAGTKVAAIRVVHKAVERAIVELTTMPVMQVDHVQIVGKRTRGEMSNKHAHEKTGSSSSAVAVARNQAEQHAPPVLLSDVLSAIDTELGESLAGTCLLCVFFAMS
jgi:hypothetical protein